MFEDIERYQTPVGKASLRRTKKRWGVGFFAWFLYKTIHSWLRVLLGRISSPEEFVEQIFPKIFRKMEKHGARFHLEGLSNLPEKNEPFVFVANHMSTLEVFILPLLLKRANPVSFVLKEELTSMPLFGRCAKFCYPSAISVPSAPGTEFTVIRDVFNRGEKLLKQGISLVIFPEAGRCLTFDRLNFSSMGAKLASLAGVSCIPIALKTDFWSNSGIGSYVGGLDPQKEVRIAMGEPISKEKKSKEVHRECLSFIEGHLRTWGVPISSEKPV